MARTAKLFMNGRSQAVRLPAEFRFSGREVFIERQRRRGDPQTQARGLRRSSSPARLRSRTTS